MISLENVIIQCDLFSIGPIKIFIAMLKLYSRFVLEFTVCVRKYL
jgi:hypothetical protein